MAVRNLRIGAMFGLALAWLVPHMAQAQDSPKGTAPATPVEDGLRVYNAGQAWWIDFDARGFSVAPEFGDWSWGLELVSYGVGTRQSEVGNQARIRVEGQRVVYSWSSILDEWYLNDDRGLEHGYTVHERPKSHAEDARGIELVLRVRGELEPVIDASGRDLEFLNDRGVSAVRYAGLTVFDANGCHLAASFERCDEGLRLRVDDCDASYPLTIDPVAQQTFLKASNTGQDDLFGASVSLSGDTLVVGAPGEESSSRTINGDQGNGPDEGYGAAYVFQRSGGVWAQEAYLKASNADAHDGFGSCVAVFGDTVAVAATGEDSRATGVNGEQDNNNRLRSGAVYVFFRSGTIWTQEAYVKASNTDDDDRFGSSLALWGDTLVVGANEESSNATGVNGDDSNDGLGGSGAVYVFRRTAGSWAQEAYLKASNTGAGDGFGESVAISGDTIVVGASGEDSVASGVGGDELDNSMSASGAAYVFLRSGTTWAQEAYLKASNSQSNDRFASEVSVSGDTIVITAPGEDSSAVGINGDQFDESLVSSGAAYVFLRAGSTWSQQAYVKASNAQAGDSFGSSVSISGDAFVVGMRGESRFSTGVNDNDTAAPTVKAENSGAAYLFERAGTSWSQQSYIKASNVEREDEFGHSVSISNGSIAVSAWKEDSSATGVNGPQFTDPLLEVPESGAVYIFGDPSPFPDSCNGDGGDQMGCTNCPCMNGTSAGTLGGCLNSVGTPARIHVTGDPSVSLPPDSYGDLRFNMSGAPPDALVVLVSGASVAPASMANPCFGQSSGVNSASFDGLRCAVMSTLRHGSRTVSFTGVINFNTGPSRVWGGEATPTVGLAAQSGFVATQTRYFQAIHRDDPLAACGTGLNTSQAIQVTFTP